MKTAIRNTSRMPEGRSEGGPGGYPISGRKPQSRGITPQQETDRQRDDSLGWTSPHALTGIICVVLITFGWVSRTELDLSPADGLGYGLGIAGLSMMVLLLGYSIRKRLRPLRNAGPMRTWFELHLILGLLGPTVILYHSKFGLGSANATISLACVLAVSGSGIGGRFLYGRMHRGLAGSRRSVNGMQRQAREFLAPLRSELERNPRARTILEAFEEHAIGEASASPFSVRGLWLRPVAWRTKRRVLRAISEADRSGPDAKRIQEAVARYLKEIRRAGELRLFEKLFNLWHAIHIPLTIILFVSAAIHVVAVHLY